jgi:hypothetical protein
MQSAPREDKRQNVPSGSDPLAVLTANADCKINFVHYAGFRCSVPKFAASCAIKQTKARSEPDWHLTECRPPQFKPLINTNGPPSPSNSERVRERAAWQARMDTTSQQEQSVQD